MNTLTFINSKDIRAHLEKLDYRFSPAETAWLIAHSILHTFKEKKEALLELIATTPDCDISVYFKHPEKPVMLHSAVKEYIKETERLETDLHKKESAGNCFYQYSIYDGTYCCWEKIDGYYTSLNKCLSEMSNDSVLELLFFGIEEAIEEKTGGKVLKAEDDFKYRIKKQYLNKYEYYELEFDLQRNLNRVSSYELAAKKNDALSVFDRMILKFPIPFEKGDIVTLPSVTEEKDYRQKYPFILADAEAFAEHDMPVAYCPAMFVKGISLKNHYTEYYPDYEEFVLKNYMNLSYFNDEFEGIDRVLPTLSDYIKRKIKSDELLEKYRTESFECLMSAKFIRKEQCCKNIKSAL